MLLATSGPPLVVEQRRYFRVRLALPVRLRWRTPFGMRLEVSETLDVSRGGLLVKREEFCEPDATLWLTFPLAPEMRFGQPETPARVVRAHSLPAGGYRVSLAFESLSPVPVGIPRTGERRRCTRSRLALPMRVQLEGFPWAEETMTIDVSENGALFGTSWVFQVGDSVSVELENIPWLGQEGHGALAARVVRTFLMSNTSEQRVAIHLKSRGTTAR